MTKRNLPAAAKMAVGAIDDLNACNITTYAEYKEGIDEVAAKMKRDITFSKSVYDKSRKTFYLSNSGDDANDGLSPETAWKTLDKINDPESVCENCNILFERGGLWRGTIRVPHNNMAYSAYGVGMKPRLYGSLRNYAHPSYWKKTEYENVWYTDICTENVGLVAINHSDVLGKYDEIMCSRNIVGKDGFEGPQDLKGEYNFYGDVNNPVCYLYCDKGNPGDVYESIELGEGTTLVAPTPNAKEGLFFDNLCLKFVGCHGIAGLGGRKNVTVQNCIFAYLGGSILKGFGGGNIVGFGNAVETYGPCDGYYVNANWIYQIYDTAITHQYSTANNDCRMNDVEYVGNLCELCHWSIEYYNNPGGGGKRTVDNVQVHHNVLRRGGYGWGSAGRAGGAALFNSFVLPWETENFNSFCNIYDRCAGGIIRFYEGGDRKIRNFNNTYIQKRDGMLGEAYGAWHTFDDAQTKILEVCREENARFFYEE
ncbi:MAG: hypothetical protein IKV98_03675 [Clostridia bacterium]|nr:hypothetical protein [Clostridia bacterium]